MDAYGIHYAYLSGIGVNLRLQPYVQAHQLELFQKVD